jgi:hypothetical protein
VVLAARAAGPVAQSSRPPASNVFRGASVWEAGVLTTGVLTAPLVPVDTRGVLWLVCAAIAALDICCCPAGFEPIAKPPRPPRPKITAAIAILLLKSFTASAPWSCLWSHSA